MIAHLRRMRRRPAANLTLVRSYLDNTTLHGLHYIGQTALSLAERLFFASAFAFVCLCAAYFIAIIYDKWSDSPVIMTLSDRTTAIASIPFPAVTICNMNQARRSVVETFANGSDDAHLLRAVCRRDPKMANSGTALANQTGWSIFRRFLMRVSHRCRYMLLYCQFGTQTHRCDHLFRTVLTDEGMCCTFNAVDKQFMLWNGWVGGGWTHIIIQEMKHAANTFYRDNETDFESIDENDKFFEHPSIFTPIDYTIERGFPTDADPWRTYPRRSLGAGSHLGLTVLAAVHANEYFCSSTNSAGLKMMLHTPNEVPRIADFGFTVNAGRESFVVVQPQIVDASPLIRTLAPDRRQCVFANESPLVYYRTYTLRNCRMECEARLEVLLCGCHQYYMPRVLQTIVVAGVVTEVQICSREEQVCVQEVRMAMASPQNDTYRCDCLPACFEINYGKRLTSTEIGYDFEVQLGQLHQVNRSFME